MINSTVAFIDAMTARYSELAPVVDENLADNDELLPHLVMADVVRWLVDHRADQQALVRSVLAWLEAAYEQGDAEVRDVIAVSGVEMIPDPGEPGSELRDQLGALLSAVDPWRDDL